MAYAALVSLENTIDRFLSHNLFSISVEEKQQVTSLLEYVTPIRDFLEVFPDESKIWEEQMRELANAAEDILEYLVLEKVFLPCDDEFESFLTGDYILELKNAINETCLKLDEAREELMKDSPDNAKADDRLKDRIRDITNEVGDIRKLYNWEKTHTRFRDEWRFLPAEFTKFTSKLQFIHHLNKRRDEIDLIMEEVMAIKNYSDAATSSSTLAPVDDIVCFHHDSADESKCIRSPKHELQLGKVMKEISVTAAKVNIRRVSSSSKEVQRGSDSSALSSSSTPPPILKNSMVGFEDHVKNIKDRLCGEPSELRVIPICGMGGIGKTTLARNVYEDKLTKENFTIRVWVTVSQDYSAENYFKPSGFPERIQKSKWKGRKRSEKGVPNFNGKEEFSRDG